MSYLCIQRSDVAEICFIMCARVCFLMITNEILNFTSLILPIYSLICAIWITVHPAVLLPIALFTLFCKDSNFT